jgi:hypothetical protein
MRRSGTVENILTEKVWSVTTHSSMCELKTKWRAACHSVHNQQCFWKTLKRCFRVRWSDTEPPYFINLESYSLTPRSRGLPEKLTGLQLVKKFLAFCGTRRFFTAFTKARHLSLSWTRSIQSMRPISLHEDPFLGAFAKLRKATISHVRPSLHPSVCLSAWNNSTPTGRTLIKFDIYDIFRNSVQKIQDSLKSDKNNRYFTWRRFHIYDNTSLNSS